MAGEAKTTEFLLSTATLMIGPQSKVMELNPTDHSLGLIKNVQVTADMGFTELTQGVNAQVVSSVNTSNNTKISGEVYEFTARNLAYGAGLDGSAAAYDAITSSFTLATAISNGSSTVVLGTGGGASFAAGDFVVLQDTANTDRLHVGKVASIATDTLTLASGYAVPTGTAFATATTTIYKVRAIKVGQVDSNETFGAKLVGIMPEGGAPVTLIFPKIKITKGLSMAFQQDNFANMPFEMTPYSLVATDPYYSDFTNKKNWMVLKNK